MRAFLRRTVHYGPGVVVTVVGVVLAVDEWDWRWLVYSILGVALVVQGIVGVTMYRAAYWRGRLDQTFGVTPDGQPSPFDGWSPARAYESWRGRGRS